MFYKFISKNLLFVCFIFLLPVLILATGCKLPQTFNPLTASRLRSVELEHLGNTALERGDNQAAEKYLSDALRLNRRDVELRRSYAESLWQQGKQHESLEQLRYAQKYGDKNGVTLNISLAEKLLVLGDIDGAYAQAEEAVKLAPQDARGWALRGKTILASVQKQLNNPNKQNEIANNESGNQQNITTSDKIRELIIKSRNDYYRAISIDPENRDVLADLANVQLLAGQPEQSLVTLQNLQDQYPPDSLPPEILRIKARSYLALKKYDDANRCLAAANKMTELK
ncbi:MAG: tetratricopeptide repeat protein [Planctomycetaceae bacterium]|jgi:Flp pilus assembly protein TadD|nr:tetratricopeptide repeat protein [Planctomycetaceae bacterium]